MVNSAGSFPFHYALMAQGAYDERRASNDPDGSILIGAMPPGWALLDSLSAPFFESDDIDFLSQNFGIVDGYAGGDGATFTHKASGMQADLWINEGTREVVVAFRGTEQSRGTAIGGNSQNGAFRKSDGEKDNGTLRSWSHAHDWIAGTVLSLGGVDFDSSVDFFDQGFPATHLVGFIKEKFAATGFTTSTTGHSLGGVLASVSAIYNEVQGRPIDPAPWGLDYLLEGTFFGFDREAYEQADAVSLILAKNDTLNKYAGFVEEFWIDESVTTTIFASNSQPDPQVADGPNFKVAHNPGYGSNSFLHSAALHSLIFEQERFSVFVDLEKKLGSLIFELMNYDISGLLGAVDLKGSETGIKGDYYTDPVFDAITFDHVQGADNNLFDQFAEALYGTFNTGGFVSLGHEWEADDLTGPGMDGRFFFNPSDIEGGSGVDRYLQLNTPHDYFLRLALQAVREKARKIYEVKSDQLGIVDYGSAGAGVDEDIWVLNPAKGDDVLGMYLTNFRPPDDIVEKEARGLYGPDQALEMISEIVANHYDAFIFGPFSQHLLNFTPEP